MQELTELMILLKKDPDPIDNIEDKVGFVTSKDTTSQIRSIRN